MDQGSIERQGSRARRGGVFHPLPYSPAPSLQPSLPAKPRACGLGLCPPTQGAVCPAPPAGLAAARQSRSDVRHSVGSVWSDVLNRCGEGPLSAAAPPAHRVAMAWPACGPSPLPAFGTHLAQIGIYCAGRNPTIPSPFPASLTWSRWLPLAAAHWAGWPGRRTSGALLVCGAARLEIGTDGAE